ncbi:MAG: DUF262 domain-containing protein [Lunatimonas sp.]|uniref:DUF262 domain-containing protein n=1 Tax=Lunatimonas sp. TaxID=2060141 RepID=UPI00263A7228|nr:DUF262 domain-containing protein [Lunatimonas sp.]MCC5937400.1 DUF262 domain-containing protein [Lunatimonas sp.]
MAVGNFSTANQTYRMLMGNGLIYSVPRFQRDYSWSDEEWDDLWRDIEHVLSPEGESAHYMGYLVLQSRDSKNFDIIDGQQRLTTLSIIVLAVLSNLQKLIENGQDPENNKRRQEQLRNSLIGYLDPVTLIAKSKLNLNRNNDNLYQNYLVPLQQAPRRNLKATEHQMRKAFEWWQTQIGRSFRTGEELAGFIDKLTDKLFFTVITVSDELNAYKVFETLNARGVKLSSTDLLKNYLFSVVHAQNQDEHELANLENQWEQLVGKLGSESFPDFLRTHWNSRNRFLRHSELFKRIRDQIRDRGQVFELIRKMQTDVDTYVALSKPEDELWTTDQRSFIGELRMFNVRQVYPLLLAGFRKFNPQEFTNLLKAVSIISFRYNVISNNPTNEQERIYNQIAEKIESQNLSVRDSLEELRPLYVLDRDFKHAFSNKMLKTTQSRNKRIARYILVKLEQHLSGNELDIDSDRFNLEHIMPENLSDYWSQISDLDHEMFVYRLGNLCLLPTGQNREIGNQGFDQKRIIYQNSEFHHVRRIATENNFWDTSRIDQTQQWMSTQATSIWRFSPFDR